MRARLGLGLALALAASCGGGEPAQVSVTHAHAWVAPPQEQHGQACRNCHPQIARDWSRTGMARSLGPITAEEFRPLTRLDPVADGAGFEYAFATSPDGTPLLLETLLGDEQRPTRPVALAFAVGSGELDRAYVAAAGPLMAFAPLEVLASADGRHAELAPGHAMVPGTRLSAPITADCLGCHTDAPPPPSFPEDLGPDPQAWQPHGISCAACHGPVAVHAELQEDHALTGSLEPAAGDPLLDLASRPRHERVSVCAACHLQGDARLALELGAHGLPEPGGDLLDARALFVAAEATDEIGFVSQVERLALSRCFTESPELDCTTCHDPHRSLHDSADDYAARQAVRGACASCHDAGSGPDAVTCSLPEPQRAEHGGDCASCHMPRTGVFDVAHVQVHDHFIRKAPPRDAGPMPAARLRTDESPSGDWRLFAWPGQPAPSYVADPGLWLTAWAGRGHEARAAELLDEPLGPLSASLPSVHVARGKLLEQAGRDGEAEAAYRRALELSPLQPTAATNLALLLGRSERAPEGLALLDRLLERHPWAEGALRNRAILRHALGNLAGMAEDLEAAFRIRPNAAVARNLAQWHESRGDAQAARAWRAAAYEADPLEGSSAASR